MLRSDCRHRINIVHDPSIELMSWISFYMMKKIFELLLVFISLYLSRWREMFLPEWSGMTALFMDPRVTPRT
jgi:hypothetical protein